ncbi:MAG: HAD hydrolase-like protein [Duncaniella sp.]|nr:HAD hydrolase-like protein [Duncaniella sp.]
MTIAFDLDDTLFPETEFVRSAYRAIASEYGRPELSLIMESKATPREAFDEAAQILGLTDASPLLRIYREHIPDIKLTPGVETTLRRLKNSGINLALITDGRSITQRNKISALGLDRYFDSNLIFISEETGADKMSGLPFRLTESVTISPPYFYVGDNPAKDFFQPRCMGWKTVMIIGDDRNIHTQDLTLFSPEFHPHSTIDSVEELSRMACL